MNRYNNIFYDTKLLSVLYSKKIDIKDDGFYVVAIRNMGKKKTNNLVYNCMFYNNVFLNSFLSFLVVKNNFSNSLLFKEWGDFIAYIDKSLVSNCDLVNNNSNFWGEYILYNEHSKSFMNTGFKNPTSYIDILDVFKKFTVILEYPNLINLIGYATNKDYYNYTNNIAKCLLINKNNSLFDIKFDDSEADLYLLKDCVFVVKDIKSFIDDLNKSGLSINKGPQSSRDLPNSAGTFLLSLDEEYRNNLYKQHTDIIDSGYVSNSAKLNRSHFSFKNIHIRLGNVRWYTTSVNRPKKSNIDSLIIKNRQKLFQDNYNLIGNILSENYNIGSEGVQRKIESILWDQENEYINKNVNGMNYDKKSFEYIESKHSDLCNLLSNPHEFKSNTKNQKNKYTALALIVIKELGIDIVSNILLSYYMDIVSIESVKLDSDSFTPGIPDVTAFNIIGKKLFNKYIYDLYIKSETKENKGTLSEFRFLYLKENSNLFLLDNQNIDYSDLDNENFFSLFGANFIWYLTTLNMLSNELDKHPDNNKETVHYLRVSQEARKILIKDSVNIYKLPQKLPMVCEPKDYKLTSNPDIIKLGGYLLNDIQFVYDLILSKIGVEEKPKIKKRNLVIDLVNGISKIPYKINTETLLFIYQFGISKKIIVDDDNKDIKYFLSNPYSNKYTKEEVKKYRSLVSKIILERNIISIAETYSKVDKIYFPLVFDFRTRIYTQTDYFDYQKNDLARGLILFTNPGKITKYDNLIIRYYKAFGANMFGNGLDKKSLNYRAEWVDNNTSDILNFEHNDIVDKAESKVSFISFCFEFKKFMDFMNNPNDIVFYTYLPIQLDASCNGYQHLALLTAETKILSKLNLDTASYDDDPKDFYLYMLDMNKKYIKNKINLLTKKKNNNISDKDISLLESYKKLIKVNLGRSIIKKLIMRESYSASVVGLVNGIVLDGKEVVIGKIKYYQYSDSDIKLTRRDIVNYVMCLKEVSKKTAPKINKLSEYLNEIVYICTKLDLKIEWTTPSGVEISQSYLIEKELKIAAFSFTKSKYTFKKYVKGKYDLRKQKRGVRPNIIHSLDGSVIAKLYNSLDNVDLYTVHDCFAVTADNVPILIYKLKKTYIDIYSDNRYLLNFDKDIRMYINKKKGNNVYDLNDNYVNIITSKNKVERVLFPDVNKVIKSNNDIASCVEKSIYPIS